MSDLAVQHEEHDGTGAFFAMKDGARVAEMTLTRLGPSQVVIEHTEVSPVLRGQGAGRALLDAAVAWARETKTKFVVVCPFAKSQFEKDPSIRDVLSGGWRGGPSR
jgi:predicted GNAT family acetyltransferase